MQPAPQRPSSFERLVPIAEGIEAFTRNSGRAFVDRDSERAQELLAQGGERQRIDSELDAAWNDMLSVPPGPSLSMTSNAALMVSLRGIADLAAAICDGVVQLARRDDTSSQPAMNRLAQMVPDMVQRAVKALRVGDAESAELVLKQGVSVDVAFAQTYHEVMQLLRQSASNYEVARELHAISRAFERIGDGATEIADSVRAAALA